MHISTITTLLLGLSLGAMASPITNKGETDVNLVRRTNSCSSKNYQIMANLWNVYLDNDADYNKQCGGGCLDNIRGRCTNVTDWKCERDSAGQAHMNFLTPSGCSNWAMTQALKACTKGEQTIDCFNDPS
ncbi:uncharacterized protein LTHEOB_11506 [Neofusicoccum parvum]|uniref:Uncharacterized protein LTHEOB_11506 n=1 Tax=Neofusicoccum parvum TaxID=310453 RepID=A0ACB5SCF5_9PEZI|nr:uncharacterized protein LTHEOB_11506 [Neofusicoccum parvum]GME65695.1 uncharacterized protein LTHEOB_11506 [Neofusicoccum parvum]